MKTFKARRRDDFGDPLEEKRKWSRARDSKLISFGLVTFDAFEASRVAAKPSDSTCHISSSER